jgi:phosphatidylglycerol:prolipoprotein diacylglycerol transferase
MGPYVHDIDPVIGQVGGLYLWWYGLGYSLAFLQLLSFLVRHRAGLHLTRAEAWTLALTFAAGVLLGGRAVQVAFDEWPLFRERPELVPAIWLGGFATHGLLIGAAAATAWFARRYGKPLLELADALVIPGALLMGLGRLGNFIDGQIVGSVTGVWWAVRFPDADGFRHPVVLYDGVKNLLLIPYLLWVRRHNPTPGAVAARFVFWYAFLRVFVDLFRDYPTHRLALGTGQTLNLSMALLGLWLLRRSRLRRLGRLPARGEPGATGVPAVGEPAPPLAVRLAFAVLVVVCLTIPSNWTQDVPARYGTRHPGMRHSAIYPAIETARYR